MSFFYITNSHTKIIARRWKLYFQLCLKTARSLQLIYRGLLRKPFKGCRIHELVRVAEIPHKAKGFVLLESVLPPVGSLELGPPRIHDIFYAKVVHIIPQDKARISRISSLFKESIRYQRYAFPLDQIALICQTIQYEQIRRDRHLLFLIRLLGKVNKINLYQIEAGHKHADKLDMPQCRSREIRANSCEECLVIKGKVTTKYSGHFKRK